MSEPKVHTSTDTADAAQPALKPCPFCGEKPRLWDSFEGWKVSCWNTDPDTGCGVQPQTEGHKTQEAAIEVWERRSEER